jgi:hypothetical protein
MLLVETQLVNLILGNTPSATLLTTASILRCECAAVNASVTSPILTLWKVELVEAQVQRMFFGSTPLATIKLVDATVVLCQSTAHSVASHQCTSNAWQVSKFQKTIVADNREAIDLLAINVCCHGPPHVLLGWTLVTSCEGDIVLWAITDQRLYIEGASEYICGANECENIAFMEFGDAGVCGVRLIDGEEAGIESGICAASICNRKQSNKANHAGLQVMACSTPA